MKMCVRSWRSGADSRRPGRADAGSPSRMFLSAARETNRRSVVTGACPGALGTAGLHPWSSRKRPVDSVNNGNTVIYTVSDTDHIHLKVTPSTKQEWVTYVETEATGVNNLSELIRVAVAEYMQPDERELGNIMEQINDIRYQLNTIEQHSKALREENIETEEMQELINELLDAVHEREEEGDEE